MSGHCRWKKMITVVYMGCNFLVFVVFLNSSWTSAHQAWERKFPWLISYAYKNVWAWIFMKPQHNSVPLVLSSGKSFLSAFANQWIIWHNPRASLGRIPPWAVDVTIFINPPSKDMHKLTLFFLVGGGDGTMTGARGSNRQVKVIVVYFSFLDSGYVSIGG